MESRKVLFISHLWGSEDLIRLECNAIFVERVLLVLIQLADLLIVACCPILVTLLR